MNIAELKSWCCRAKINTRVIKLYPSEAIDYCSQCRRIMDVKGLIRSKRNGKL